MNKLFAAVLCIPSVLALLLPTPAPAQETRAPLLKNAEEVREDLLDRYTLEMRRQGLVGTPVVEMVVRSHGEPAQIRLAEHSGNIVLDRLAVQIARDMRFQPALADGEEVDQRVRLPLAFESTCGVDPPTSAQPELADLLDGLDVVAISELDHPRSVLLDVRIDTAGRPTAAEILESSGLPDADSLAVREALNSRYVPVRWDDSPVPVRFRDTAFPRLGGPANPASECETQKPPRIKNRNFLVRSLEMVARGIGDSRQPVSQEAAALLWVQPDGRVGQVLIHESSCWRELDSYLKSIWLATEFEPATCEGRPIGTHTILPVQLGIRRR